jgi:hypothetical protein
MKDEAEIPKDTGGKIGIDKQEYIPVKPTSKLRRELADEELNNPAVQKLLLGEIDRLELRANELESFESRFHQSDKEKAVLEEKLKAHNALDILHSFCLAAGSAIMGLSSLVKINETGWIFLVVGGLLVLGGILSKYGKWK